MDRGPFGTDYCEGEYVSNHGIKHAGSEYMKCNSKSMKEQERPSLLGYVRGIGSGSTSPKSRRIGGRTVNRTGPEVPMIME